MFRTALPFCKESKRGLLYILFITFYYSNKRLYCTAQTLESRKLSSSRMRFKILHKSFYEAFSYFFCQYLDGLLVNEKLFSHGQHALTFQRQTGDSWHGEEGSGGLCQKEAHQSRDQGIGIGHQNQHCSPVILFFHYPSSDTIPQNVNLLKFLFNIPDPQCAADFSLLNLPKGKSLGRSKPATNS